MPDLDIGLANEPYQAPLKWAKTLVLLAFIAVSGFAKGGPGCYNILYFRLAPAGSRSDEYLNRI